jgi:hypothetical protein
MAGVTRRACAKHLRGADALTAILRMDVISEIYNKQHIAGVARMSRSNRKTNTAAHGCDYDH